MRTEDFKFMREALVEAKKAEQNGEVPIGCVIVNEKKIISRSGNMVETLCQASEHAEMRALKKAAEILGGYRLKNATLYTTLEPCPMCAGAIKLYRIKRVVCGARDYKKGAASSAYRIVSAEFGVLEDECEKILKDFFKKIR